MNVLERRATSQDVRDREEEEECSAFIPLVGEVFR